MWRRATKSRPPLRVLIRSIKKRAAFTYTGQKVTNKSGWHKTAFSRKHVTRPTQQVSSDAWTGHKIRCREQWGLRNSPSVSHSSKDGSTPQTVSQGNSCPVSWTQSSECWCLGHTNAFRIVPTTCGRNVITLFGKWHLSQCAKCSGWYCPQKAMVRVKRGWAGVSSGGPLHLEPKRSLCWKPPMSSNFFVIGTLYVSHNKHPEGRHNYFS